MGEGQPRESEDDELGALGLLLDERDREEAVRVLLAAERTRS